MNLGGSGSIPATNVGGEGTASQLGTGKLLVSRPLLSLPRNIFFALFWTFILALLHPPFWFPDPPSTDQEDVDTVIEEVDMSPTYLKFMKYSCYYIIHLGCFICIYMLFYMIFGTNLLT